MINRLLANLRLTTAKLAAVHALAAADGGEYTP